MVERLLVTTAIEETWGSNEAVLFLGEWCKRFVRRERWTQMDSEVVPYHWDDRVKLQEDFLYLKGLYERLLQDLATQLNLIHNVDHGVRYWRILIGPWLGYFTQILFDRWSSVHQAINRYDISGTVVLTLNAEDVVPNDMLDFIGAFVGDNWNHSLYSAILQQFTSVICVPGEVSRNARAVNGKEQAGQLKGVRPVLMDLYTRGTGLLRRNRESFLLGSGLSAIDELAVCRRLGQLPNRWRSIPGLPSQLDENKRKWVLGGRSENEFEIAIRALISQYLPKTYLEGYSQLSDQVAGLPWPKHPKMIWSSNSYNSDDVFKAWVALKAEAGSTVVAGQHGGHYGVGRWSFNEDHEIAISDRYLSWGWSKADAGKVFPVGQFNPKRPLKVVHGRLPGALLVTCTMPQQSYVLYSSIVASQWLEYFEDQCRFVARLPKSIQSALTVRFYPHDYGWSQRERWKEKFSNLRLDEGAIPIDELIGQSRLYISTYNATTYLESFNMDVPTVIYWNPEQWELRDSAMPFFESLKEVGIFHESPESAADHVSRIWDNVEEWWHGDKLRRVLADFKNQYCRTPDNLLDQIEKALQGAISSKSVTTHHE
ncbi:MAG: LIC12162 family protein [Pseudomonadota bacterium]